jgi:hypothetical protein
MAICGGLLGFAGNSRIPDILRAALYPFKREQNMADFCPVYNRQNRPFSLATNFCGSYTVDSYLCIKPNWRIWKSRSSDNSAINLLFWASIIPIIVVVTHWWFSCARERISRLSPIDTHRPSLLRSLDCVSPRFLRWSLGAVSLDDSSKLLLGLLVPNRYPA